MRGCIFKRQPGKLFLRIGILGLFTHTASESSKTVRPKRNLITRRQDMSTLIPAPSAMTRKAPHTHIPKPSLFNIVLVCALFVVWATRKRPPIFDNRTHTLLSKPKQIGSQPMSLFHRAVLSTIPKGLVQSEAKLHNQVDMKKSEMMISSSVALETTPPTQVKFDSDIAAAARRARPFPPCASDKSRAKSFLMVFMGHSGSSAILSELRSHPDVYMDVMELVDHQEVFNSTEALITTRRFFERGVRAGKVPGFKMRPLHILEQPALFRKLFDEFGTRIIWQYRNNLFKASIGEYAVRFLNDDRAVEGLRYNLTDEDRCKHEKGCSFCVKDVDFLHKILQAKVNSHNLISDAIHKIATSSLSSSNRDAVKKQACIRELPYEDYLYNREDTMMDVFQFLGLSWKKTAPQRFKANGDNLCEVVENWQEVCQAFYPCITWKHMLDDARHKCFCTSTGGPTKYCHAQET